MKDDNAKLTKRPRGIYILPNLFTISALFAGFYAIVAAMRGDFISSAMAIYVAMLMDALDGRVARLTNTQTAFGAELDSLSDMVSSGIAPALVVYTWCLHDIGKIGWLVAFLYAVAVALRLARFNTQVAKVDKRYFQGLPCPAAAGVIAGLVWTFTHWGVPASSLSWLVALITVLVSFFMVSTTRYRSFKDLDLKGRIPFVGILALVLVIVFIAIDPPSVLLLIFLGYAFSGVVTSVVMGLRWRKRRKERLAKRKTTSDKNGDKS